MISARFDYLTFSNIVAVYVVNYDVLLLFDCDDNKQRTGTYLIFKHVLPDPGVACINYSKILWFN